MKDKFIEIKNVKRFRSAVDRIHHAKLKGVERMALIFGAPGLGKSETALQFAANNGALYMRMKKLMTARWFLRELIDGLGSSPGWRTEDLFNQVLDLLNRRKRTLILDEVDYFTSDSKVTETLRDIHDITGTAMLFIGMNQAELSKRTGLPKRTIKEIIGGKAAITAETALQRERVLRIPASFWNNLEKNYQRNRFQKRDGRVVCGRSGGPSHP